MDTTIAHQIQLKKTKKKKQSKFKELSSQSPFTTETPISFEWRRPADDIA